MCRRLVSGHFVQGVHQCLVQALAPCAKAAAIGPPEGSRHREELLRGHLRRCRGQTVKALPGIAGPALPGLIRPAAKGTGAHRRQTAHAAGHGAQRDLRHHLRPESAHVHGHVSQLPQAEFRRRKVLAALPQQLVRLAVQVVCRLLQRGRVDPVPRSPAPVVLPVCRGRQEPARRLRQAAQGVLPGPLQRQPHAGESAAPQLRQGLFQLRHGLPGLLHLLRRVPQSLLPAGPVIERLPGQQRRSAVVALLGPVPVPGLLALPQFPGRCRRRVHALLVAALPGPVIVELIAAQLGLCRVGQVSVLPRQLRQDVFVTGGAAAVARLAPCALGQAVAVFLPGLSLLRLSLLFQAVPVGPGFLRLLELLLFYR